MKSKETMLYLQNVVLQPGTLFDWSKCSNMQYVCICFFPWHMERNKLLWTVKNPSEAFALFSMIGCRRWHHWKRNWTSLALFWPRWFIVVWFCCFQTNGLLFLWLLQFYYSLYLISHTMYFQLGQFSYLILTYICFLK